MTEKTHFVFSIMNQAEAKKSMHRKAFYLRHEKVATQIGLDGLGSIDTVVYGRVFGADRKHHNHSVNLVVGARCFCIASWKRSERGVSAISKRTASDRKPIALS